MGWKNVRDHYRIDHIVQVVPERGICIGSPYIHDIMVISPDGKLAKVDEWATRGVLNRYREEMEADPDKLRELALAPDTFGETTTVYTYDREGKIVEHQAEGVGWPNVTTTGEMQYENTFSTNREQVLAWARRNAEFRVENAQQFLEQRTRELAEAEIELARAIAARDAFASMRPTPAASTPAQHTPLKEAKRGKGRGR